MLGCWSNPFILSNNLIDKRWSLFLIQLSDLGIHRLKVTTIFLDHRIQLADVEDGLVVFVLNLRDDNHEDVLADLHFLDVVLVVKQLDLEVIALAHFGELVFEVSIQRVHCCP